MAVRFTIALKRKSGVLEILLEQTFAAGKLKEEKNHAILLEAAKAVYGNIDTVRIGMAGAQGASGEETPPVRLSHVEQIAKIDEQARQKMLQKPSVADALEVFGGEIISIDD